ncbi:MAG: 50S ribosomal protein L6 [Candidatus Woesearchaeota archaeon]
MNVKNYKEKLNVPAGITVKLDAGLLTVTGTKGELKRNFFDPNMKISIQDNAIVVDIPKMSKREKTQLGTIFAHMKNMFRGVNEGFVYKLKICSGHFPMNVTVKNHEFIIKNFIGEKVPRILRFNPCVSIKIDGDIVTIEAIDIELAGQVASQIEKLSTRVGFDRRIFQQGIFITEKPE